MADYFCYISQAKVESLLQQIEERTTGTVSVETVRETEKSVNPVLGKILTLFSVGASFGKKDRIVISAVEQESIVQKLRRAILHLVSTVGLPDLGTEIQVEGRLESVYYSFQGCFKVKEFDGQSAILESQVSDDVALELDCSVKYFSDLGMQKGRFIPHSGNRAFFSGRITPTFKTVLVVLDFKKPRIVGSPLFLALQPIGELDL